VSPEIQRIFFDVVANSANTERANGRPLTVQWQFSDADPWHVVVANGSTRAEPGEASKPDVTLQASWGDWIGISKGTLDARRALIKRRLRVHGKPRGLLAFSRTFPRRAAPISSS
jgi:putative sterol carrier protein